jgi:hypothetical protein
MASPFLLGLQGKSIESVSDEALYTALLTASEDENAIIRAILSFRREKERETSTLFRQLLDRATYAVAKMTLIEVYKVEEGRIPGPPDEVSICKVHVWTLLMNCRVHPDLPFTAVLALPLPFKIPVATADTVTMFPDIFTLGNSEYHAIIDVYLNFNGGPNTSETTVAGTDLLWQNILQMLCGLQILHNEKDASSKVILRPDFTAMYNGMLVMKAGAKANSDEIPVAIKELTDKFHSTAHYLFPAGSRTIPGVATSLQSIVLREIFFTEREMDDGTRVVTFDERSAASFNVLSRRGRGEFIVAIFKIARWILSQTVPIAPFHIASGVRLRTTNGHHITLLAEGILKEFYHDDGYIPYDILRKVYAAKLNNVEHGRVNSNSVMITSVGRRLQDAISQRLVTTADALAQIRLAVEQLHSIGVAHCDIFSGNVFVEMDTNRVFLGDLEYCRDINEAPPVGITRASSEATSAQHLDYLQLTLLEQEMETL